MVPARIEQQEARHPLVIADRVRVEFGNLVAVRDVSLRLYAGDLVGLIGPNGAGKTTLLRLLAGLQPPTAGEATIMGDDVFGVSRDVRRHIGLAPDAPPVYEDVTVQDFLLFIAHAYDLSATEAEERIDFWLEQLWLADRRHEMIKNLSRGMLQRVTVARTLVPNPNVILLDEPSAGLDPAGRIQFRGVLASLRDQGKALIVSSHILADLEEYCTHIAIIEQGRIIRSGPVAELHGRSTGRQHYRLTLAADVEGVRDVLAAIEGVSDTEARDGAWFVEYDEGPARAAHLLGILLERGLPLASFTPVSDSLEDVYLKSGVKQVD